MRFPPLRALAFYRRLSLTTKMVVLGGTVGGVFLFLADQVEHDVLREVLLKELSSELTFEAQQDRKLFNGYIEDFSSAAKLIVSQKRFLDYVSSSRWREGGGAPRRHHFRPPSWMPKSSVLRSFFNADHVLLLDRAGKVREIYDNRPHAEGEPGLPAGLLRPSPLLRKLSHNQAYLTTVDGRHFLLSAQSVEAATLLLVSALDEELLRRIRESQQSNNVLAIDTATGVDPGSGRRRRSVRNT